MLDTYFDRCDAAAGYRPTPSRPAHDDPRCFNGALYATMIDRDVAEARFNLAHAIARSHTYHLHELRLGIPLAQSRIPAFGSRP